jgi:hypothetical protein
MRGGRRIRLEGSGMRVHSSRDPGYGSQKETGTENK